ncbi:MAG: response regulator [Candidatus Margulisbacteria bacterium]|nr:response regulator [Candidatus Margulisiibacteriota bacterium]
MAEETYTPGQKDKAMVPSRKPLILIVEDEADMRDNLIDLLGKQYDIITSDSGKDALRKYEANQNGIDIALVDIRLPDISGVEVLHKMKNISLRPDVIMVTALKDLELAINAMKEGAYDYITKPFFAEDILSTIERATEKEDYLRKLREINLRMEKEKIFAERRAILIQELKMQRKLEGKELSLDEQACVEFLFPVQDYDLNELKRKLEFDLGHTETTVIPKQQGKNILIVEDEEDMRENLKELLKDSYSTTAAATGEEALKAMLDNKFDLVLLDIRLPDIYGIELLKRIKLMDPLISAVMLTALKDVETAVAAMKAGAYDYITKPFFQADLIATIERTLMNREYKNVIDGLLKKLREAKLSYNNRHTMLKELMSNRKAEGKKITLGDVFCFFPEYADEDLYSEVELPDLPADLPLDEFLNRLKTRKIKK